MSNPIIRFTAAATIALLPALAAAPRPAAAQELPALRIAWAEDADALDPTLSRTYVGRIALVDMCDSLFTYNDKLAIVPQLATGYEWTDSKTLVVKLRPGAVFHDGTPVDAAAVKYSLERHATMSGSARKGDVATMDHVEVIDPLTVRFVLKTPDVVFLSQLAARAGVLVSPKAAEAEGKDFALHPVCAGPYKFVERVAQDRIVLERFAQHWDAANYHFGRVVFRPIVDSTARLANLQSGAVDINGAVVPTDADTVRKDPKLKLYAFDGLGYNGITFNLGRTPPGQTPIGTDARVRRAFELAIDRDALVKVVFNGMYAVTAQPVPPSSPFYQPSVAPTKRDVAKAKSLLAEAGVKPPAVVNLITTNSPEAQQIGVILQSMAAEAGFTVKLVTMEFASSLDAVERGDFSAFLIGWSGRPDADGNIRDLLHTGAPIGWAGYHSTAFDGLIDQARSIPDMEQRGALYAKAFEVLHQDLPILYLYSPSVLFGMSAKLQGFVPVADGMIRLTGVTLAK
jgi:peptide/nickel transport system substrate-binding protein